MSESIKKVSVNGISFEIEDSKARALDVLGLSTGGFASNQDVFLVAVEKRVLRIFANTTIAVGDTRVNINANVDLPFMDLLDTGSVAAGKDYYVYLSDSGEFIVSLNSTFPDGFMADNTRKIGGFHTLCADVGEIAGHTLSGYVAGDILPASVWCLNHHPYSAPEGMVYIPETDVWVDIYNTSGSLTSPKSVYGGTRLHTLTHYQFAEAMLFVNKSLLTDADFTAAMEGSNQKTAVKGAAQPNPDTTGGRVDTAGRRMISNYGCEEGCGLQWQWLDCGQNANGGSGWAAVTGIDGVAGSKGSSYGVPYALLAGGDWANSTNCGSRSRNATNARSNTRADNGGRGRSRNCTR